jgi:membrane associated rhomboid family serine protease
MLRGAVTMNQQWQILLLVTGDRQLAEEWELVLLAQGLSPSLRRTADGFALSVPREELAAALASLAAYERENPRQPAERVESVAPASWLVGDVGLTLLIIYYVTVQWLPALSWFVRGSADAQRIVQGELWRTVTALTLHADAAHVLSNALAVALFLSVVSSLVGAGLAGALVLLAGAGGNLANAFLHGSSHVSVGASTAVFGAVGLLGSPRETAAPPSVSQWRDWLPVAALLPCSACSAAADSALTFGRTSSVLVGAMLGFVVLGYAASAGAVSMACGAAARDFGRTAAFVDAIAALVQRILSAADKPMSRQLVPRRENSGAVPVTAICHRKTLEPMKRAKRSG